METTIQEATFEMGTPKVIVGHIFNHASVLSSFHQVSFIFLLIFMWWAHKNLFPLRSKFSKSKIQQRRAVKNRRLNTNFKLLRTTHGTLIFLPMHLSFILNTLIHFKVRSKQVKGKLSS